MEKITTKVSFDKIEYKANDGRIFDNKGSCLHHEWRLQAIKVYAVLERGQRSEAAEVYSTRELAEENLPTDKHLRNRFIITEVYIDERSYLVAANKGVLDD